MYDKFNIGDKVIVIRGDYKGLICNITNIMRGGNYTSYKVLGNEEELWFHSDYLINYKEYNRNKLLEELLGGL